MSDMNALEIGYSNAIVLGSGEAHYPQVCVNEPGLFGSSVIHSALFFFFSPQSKTPNSFIIVGFRALGSHPESSPSSAWTANLDK